MKVTPDTDVLVRAAVPARNAESEDAQQSARAQSILRDADLVAVTLPALCEFVWVLRSVYKYSRNEITMAVQSLCAARTVTCDRDAVSAGLTMMSKGGDFADGVIAHAGTAMESDTFVSFDRRAVRILQQIGHKARIADEPASEA